MSTEMRADWDHRADENWIKAIIGRDMPEEEFWRAGEIEYRDVIAPHVRQRGLVVEIGCGAGRILRYATADFETAIGFDVSPRMIELAKQANPGLDLRITDGSSLPGMADGSADLVYCLAVLQHIPDRAAVRAYMREAARVLAPGGVFVFTVLTRTGWTRLFGIPLPRAIVSFVPTPLRRWWRLLRGTRADRTRPTWHGGVSFFPFGLRRLLRSYGFGEIELTDIGKLHLRFVVAVRRIRCLGPMSAPAP